MTKKIATSNPTNTWEKKLLIYRQNYFHFVRLVRAIAWTSVRLDLCNFSQTSARTKGRPENPVGVGEGKGFPLFQPKLAPLPEMKGKIIVYRHSWDSKHQNFVNNQILLTFF